MTSAIDNSKPILAAEINAAEADRLLRCLSSLGKSARLATSVQEAIELMRREVFARAIVAVELALGDEPLLRRLCSLPAIEQIVATGPPADERMETRARQAGADVYLSRPIDMEALAVALHVPRSWKALARPP